MSKPTFVDLFAGAGGSTQGLKSAGFEHVVGVEWDRAAAETYRANHGHVINDDIRKVTAATVAPLLRGRRLTLLAASPPCQTFSQAARKTGSDVGEGTPPKDGVPDERDTLYREVARLAGELKPRWVMTENVVGMGTKPVPGAGGRTALADLVARLQRLGYRCAWRIVLATEFGVPQLRKRLLMIASLPGEAAPEDVFPRPARLPPSAIATAGLLEAHPPASAYLHGYSRERLLKRVAAHDFVTILNPAGPARTITARYHGSPSVLVKEAGGRVRTLTNTEIARVQTFPDSYKWPGSVAQTARQVGNAVPPRMAAAFGRAIAAAAAHPKGVPRHAADDVVVSRHVTRRRGRHAEE